MIFLTVLHITVTIIFDLIVNLRKKMSSTDLQVRNCTPIAPTKVNLMLNEGKLQPFDQNYTLTGLLKDIQGSINQLISSKRHKENAPNIDANQEMVMLERIQEEVIILKTIVVHNINQIFSSIYPPHVDMKSENPTNHTDSHKRRNEEELLNKSMIISDFDLDGNNKINALEVNKENLAHHQKVYAQDKQDESGSIYSKKVYLNGESQCQDMIRIEDEERIENVDDLICYQDDKTIIINKKRYIDSLKNIRINNFSPISERPIEEEYSVEKGNIEEKRDNGVALDKRFNFNPYRQNLYVSLMARYDEQIKKCQLGQKSQSFRRASHRKFNYLDQFSKK